MEWSRAFGVVSVTLVAGCAAAAADWPQIVLEERLSGFSQPVGITHAGDGSGRAWAYASIIDRLSRDPTTIPVQLSR
jgi:hypothetical protein